LIECAVHIAKGFQLNERSVQKPIRNNSRQGYVFLFWEKMVFIFSASNVGRSASALLGFAA